MSFYERYEGLVNTAFGAVFSTMVATGVWLIRRILTNQQQIAELKAEIERREARREIELQTLMEMKTDIREVRADVKTLFARGDVG